MFKFKPYDKVFIKSLNKYGIVISSQSHCPDWVKNYEIRCEEDYWQDHLGFDFSTYLGKKPVFYDTREDDLEKVPESYLEVSDECVKSWADLAIELAESMYPKTASSEDLDKLGNLHNLPKGSNGQIWGVLPDGTMGWIDPPSTLGLRGIDGYNWYKNQIATECPHSWKKYEGFTNSYDYCEKCDLKR